MVNKKGVRILVSAIGGDIGTSIARSLRSENWSILGCDIRSIPKASLDCDAFFVVPPAQEEKSYVRELLTLLVREKIDFFIPVSEPEICAVNANRAVFQSTNVGLAINNPLILDNFLDKYRTACFLNSLGVPVPKTVLLSEDHSALSFPFIAKLRSGSGSRKLRIIRSQQDLSAIPSDGEEWILQEYLDAPNDEFTTGIFSDGNAVASISFRRRLGFGGLTSEAELVNDPRLEALALKIAGAVALKGCINLQTRLIRGQYIPFEINPRLSSTLLFRKRFGFDDACWWIQMLMGKTFQYHPRYRAGCAIRTLGEAYYNMLPEPGAEPLLDGQDIYLRRLCEDDITEEYIQGLNDPDVKRYLSGTPNGTHTRASVASFIRLNQADPCAIFWGIFLKNDPAPLVGTIRISGIDRFHYSASLGICIFAKRAQKKGYASQAVRIATSYAFDHLGLRYLEAGAYAENTSSIELFLRTGFKEQYRIPGKYRHKNAFKETVYLAAINPDFRLQETADKVNKVSVSEAKLLNLEDGGGCV